MKRPLQTGAGEVTEKPSQNVRMDPNFYIFCSSLLVCLKKGLFNCSDRPNARQENPARIVQEQHMAAALKEWLPSFKRF